MKLYEEVLTPTTSSNILTLNFSAQFRLNNKSLPATKELLYA